MATTGATKVTKTYFLVSEKDDVYKKGIMLNPNDGSNTNPTMNNSKTSGHCKWTFRFPEEFIHSVNPRFIEVHNITLACNGVDSTSGAPTRILGDIMLHSSFIKRNDYLDKSVMICNQMRTKFKKYAYTSAEQTFDVWFTSFINPNWRAEFEKTTFIIEMMLIY